jgi:hypothetical protein
MSERGQASLELLATLPVVIVAGVLCLQLLAAGYALTLADGAAEAGAVALASELPPEPAVEAALPNWAKERVAVDRDGGRVTVSLSPPSPFVAIGRALEVSSSAWIRQPADAG